MTTLGEFFLLAAMKLWLNAGWLNQLICLIVLGLIVVRYCTDRFNVNPFGRAAFYLRRPTDRWYSHVKRSSLYYPFRKALQREPVWLMMVLGLLLVFLMLPGLFSIIAGMLHAVGMTFFRFGNGQFGAGLLALVGTALLCFLYFVMLLLSVLVLHFFFGLLAKQAEWAGRRINPLIFRIDPSGRFFPIIFVLFSFAIQLLAGVVSRSFF